MVMAMADADGSITVQQSPAARTGGTATTPAPLITTDVRSASVMGQISLGSVKVVTHPMWLGFCAQLFWGMSEERQPQICSYCNLPLIELDAYGERLCGCVGCNKWQALVSGEWRHLSDDDIAALSGMVLTSPSMSRIVIEPPVSIVTAFTSRPAARVARMARLYPSR
jgi:hypothetical protein